jgi:glycosyltransferase involved in cell wall biosynthesis
MSGLAAPLVPSPSAEFLRIAWLVYRGNPHSGGQGVYTRYVARELRDMGHHVEVLSGQPYPVLDDGVKLIKVPSMDLFRADDPWHIPTLSEIKERFQMGGGPAAWGIDFFEFAHMCTSGFPEPWTFSMRARRYLRAHATEFDIVHDNQCFGYGVRGMVRDGLPVVATLHHPITVDRDLEIADLPRVYPSKASIGYLKRRWSLYRWYGFLGMQVDVAKGIPRIITVSESSKRDIVAQMHVPADQLHIVPVGVDHERFKPMPHITRRPHRIMTTASADVPLKGLRPLLEALAKVRVEHPIDVVIVGKKREGSVLPELLDRLGLNDVVTFESGVSDDRIVELYNEAEMVVVPSLYEGFSIPAIESMACGTPLITTTGGALPEVVGPSGEAAITVAPNDPDALAAAILLVLRDPALRAALGAAGRARVLKGFTWRVAAEGCVEQYRALLEDNARAAHDALASGSTGLSSGSSSVVAPASGTVSNSTKAKGVLASATEAASGAAKGATEFAKNQAKNLGRK